ncbi:MULTISPECIES: IS66 family insertion sequence element accessory protein TnpA [unclassified Pseudoalteromonas]|uniref:IS66 family insertion sequence element accessory protein TnpA n=1 Tax=unclassified Pseudoalteromonas TaxID=194690 RepID=UPI00301544FF
MPKHRTAELWQQLIEQHKQSGLSVRAFCQEHHLSVTTFYDRRAKLKENQATRSEFATAKTEVVKPPTTKSSIFLSCKGSKLELPATTDAIWLAHLIKALA